MALTYYPKQGEIVWCGYDYEVIEPEMKKPRPSVVVSPRLRRRPKLVSVVPLSFTSPDPQEEYHCLLELQRPLPAPFDSPVCWAKCDMISTVSLDRLDRFKERHAVTGVRLYRTGQLTANQLLTVRKALLTGLGFGSLTSHL